MTLVLNTLESGNISEQIKALFADKNEEIEIINRGRNATSHKSKTTDIVTYHKATGLECLIGYLYENNQDRLNELMERILCE